MASVSLAPLAGPKNTDNNNIVMDKLPDEMNDMKIRDDKADEETVVSNLVRSKLSSKAGFDEKIEALERAEEAYYKHKGPIKRIGLSENTVISEILRETSKQRLTNALNKAEERLGKQLIRGKSIADKLAQTNILHANYTRNTSCAPGRKTFSKER